MPIKRSYNNAHERMSDKAEKAILPLLEQRFIHQFGLRPMLTMEYDLSNHVCKVDVAFPKVGGKFEVHYYEHKQMISYPLYTEDQMSQLIERVARCVVGVIQDTVSTWGTQDPKRYAKEVYAACIEDEETFLTWIDQVRVRVTPKDELLRYYTDHKHEVNQLLKDEGYLTPFHIILYSFNEDEIKDMSDTTLEYIVRVVNDIRKLHQSN